MWDLPDQGLNPNPLHWKAKSQPLGRQGSLHLLGLRGEEPSLLPALIVGSRTDSI